MLTIPKNIQYSVHDVDQRGHDHAYQKGNSQSFLIKQTDFLFLIFGKVRTNDGKPCSNVLDDMKHE